MCIHGCKTMCRCPLWRFALLHGCPRKARCTALLWVAAHQNSILGLRVERCAGAPGDKHGRQQAAPAPHAGGRSQQALVLRCRARPGQRYRSNYARFRSVSNRPKLHIIPCQKHPKQALKLSSSQALKRSRGGWFILLLSSGRAQQADELHDTRQARTTTAHAAPSAA